LQIGVNRDDASMVGSAMLASAEAQLLQGNRTQAAEYAEEAATLFENVDDAAQLQAARKVLADAQKEPPKPRPKFGASRPGQPQHFAGAGEDDVGEVRQRNLRAPEDKLPNWNQRGAAPAPAWPEEDTNTNEQRPAGRAGGRRGFSNMADQMAPRKGFSNLPEDVILPPYKEEPNQDMRRRQMIESMNQKATAPPSQAALDKNPLWGVLHAVKPEWNATELRIVQEKLNYIDVQTVQELWDTMNRLGADGVNKKLKSVGKKPLKTETLEAISLYGQNLAAGE